MLAAYAARVHPELADDDSMPPLSGPELSDAIIASAIDLSQQSGYLVNPSKHSIVALTAIACFLHDQDIASLNNKQTLSIFMTCMAQIDQVRGNEQEAQLVMPRVALSAVYRRKPQSLWVAALVLLVPTFANSNARTSFSPKSSSVSYLASHVTTRADYALILHTGLARYQSSHRDEVHLGHVTLDMVYCCYLISEQVFGRDQYTQENAIRNLWSSYDVALPLLQRSLPSQEDAMEEYTFGSYALSMMVSHSYFLDTVHQYISPTNPDLLAESSRRCYQCRRDLISAIKSVRGYYERRHRNIHLSSGVGILRDQVARVILETMDEDQNSKRGRRASRTSLQQRRTAADHECAVTISIRESRLVRVLVHNERATQPSFC